MKTLRLGYQYPIPLSLASDCLVSIGIEMSHTSLSFANLPVELTTKILSYLAPDNVRSLRYVIIACRGTNHEALCGAAEHILDSQRTWLLDRWNQVYEEQQANSRIDSERLLSLKSIAERIIGKQYVEATEVVDRSDHWVSLLASLYIPLPKLRIR